MASIEDLRPLLARVCRTHHWRVSVQGTLYHVQKPLTDDHVARHLVGGERVGACPLTPGESTTRCAVLDFDSHKGETDWHTMMHTAHMVCDALREVGIAPAAFRSSGGAGVHLIMLWAAPQDAYSVREAMALALAKCNLRPGTKGVKAGEVEVYPKQDSVPADGFGSMFVLPLAGKSAVLNLDARAVLEEPPVWRASAPVEVLQKPERPAPAVVVSSPDTDRLRAALAAIPNVLDYDAWRNVVFGIHHATGGGDDGLALAHEFSARSPKYNPEFLDKEVWPYIRDRENAITAQSIINAAEKHGWVDPAVVDAFEVVAPDPADVPPAGAYDFLTLEQFTARQPLRYLIKNVLPGGGLAVVYGESGSGKTFLVLDMVGAIARGVPWRGNRVMQGRVGYICAEGAGGFRNRVNAYLSANELKPGDMENLRVLPNAPNFMKADNIKAIIENLKTWGNVSVIVVDTFAQVMPGANENAGEDVGKAIHHCAKLHEATGALVLLVHHAGKDASKGARGWSGLRAACDAEIEITRDDKDRTATITKLKDGEDGGRLGFTLRTVPVGWDDDGDVVSSCVVTHCEATAKTAAGRTGAVQKALLRALEELSTAPRHVLIAAAVHLLPATYLGQDGKRDRRPEILGRALDALVQGGTLVDAAGVIRCA